MTHTCRNCLYLDDTDPYPCRDCDSDRSMWEQRIRIPNNPDDCSRLYEEESGIPDGMCAMCGCGNLRSSDDRWCPLGATNIKKQQAKEPVVVTGSRYYQPPQDDGQIELLVGFPMLVEE